MKNSVTLILCLSLLLFGANAMAQQQDILKQCETNPAILDGTDMLCPTTKVPLSPSPKGYKPFYLSHYGRHGARYAWQSDLYERLNNILTKAEQEDNLTALGKDYKSRFDGLYPDVRYRVGDLSRKGWEQQKGLAALMYGNYPDIFKKDAHVRAWTSTSTRCVMTMSAFCIGLQSCDPKLDIFEHFGKFFLPAILPQDSGNPFRDKNYEKIPLKYSETWAQYIERTIDYKTILTRLFKDIDLAVEPKKQWDTVSYLWFFAVGMNSLDTDLSFKDIFTQDELVALWKIDSFQFYSDAWPGRLGHVPIVKDIVAKADERILSGEKGADLRFGHDYTILPLLMLLNVDGMGHAVENPDDIINWCPSSQVPMGANVHLVFYKSNKKGAPVLFKVLLNGREAHIPLETSNWPYYDWEAFKASLAIL